MSYVKTHVVARRNARGGRSAAEHLVAALRCLYRHAEDDGLISRGENPARKVDKPRRLPSTRRAVTDDRLAEINQAAATTGDDPELDTLLLRLHTETACRRGGALALRPAGPGPRPVPDPAAGERRDGPLAAGLAHLDGPAWSSTARSGTPRPDGQLLRYRNGRPITSRRYDGLWARIGRVPALGPHPADQHALDPAHHPDLGRAEFRLRRRPRLRRATPTAAATPARPRPTSAPRSPRWPPPWPR